MIRIHSFYVMLLAATIVCPQADASAQEEMPTPSMSDDELHEELRELRDGLLAALDAKDSEAIISFMREDVVITTQDGTDLNAIVGIKAVQDYLGRMLTGENPGVESLDFNLEVDALTHLYNGNTGVAYGHSKDHYVLSEGGEFDLETRWSATLIRDKEWKLASIHVSSNLFENPVLDAAKSLIYYVGGGACLAGLLLGFLACRMFSSKSKA